MISRRDVFQAIADPTRRAIIMLLAAGATTPNTLAEHFNTSRQAISKHLQILTECQLVEPQPKGREIYYCVNPQKMNEIETWLQQFKNLMAQRFTQLDDVLTQLKNNRT
ncbi:MAG TPA: metalloregulator ArsR/SmtB family transcription factor [Phnomibacter sp.]|nr:metalloregulator ArsR/SmtB family transcription factor [Phnomibacter sp.]